MNHVAIVLISLCTAITNVVTGQSVTIVPTDFGNDRFLAEYQTVIRPSLSVNGFDNAGATSRGLGLKQVLNLALSGDSYARSKLVPIVFDAQLVLLQNPNNDGIEENSRILQHTAFEALASYVLEKNGITPGIAAQHGIVIRPHDVAMAELRAKLLFVSDLDSVHLGHSNFEARDRQLVSRKSDFVKNVKSYQNIARAVDLYLAIENAYKYWDYAEWNNPLSSVLLTRLQKHRLNIAVKGAIERIHDDLHAEVLIFPTGVQVYEVEPGNRPLKGFLAKGYLALATQNPFSDMSGGTFINHFGISSYNVFTFNSSPPAHFQEARSMASSTASASQRTRYWMYQSNNGARQWAEGPYYLDYALADAIPFWHAVRINGLLGSVPDPFMGSNRWFLNPVEWLADVSTPDGFVPPIDDGNKFRIRNTDLLRWSDEYGDPVVGGKYATVYNNTLQYYSTQGQTYHFNNYQYLIDIAIPKRSAAEVTALPNLMSPSGQEFLHRHVDTGGNMHYLFMNKEFGNAITRGEGHEQPDQLQLLYYVNNHSYLVDGGYDEGQIGKNSTWSGYVFNNNMHYNLFEINNSYVFSKPYVTYQNYGGAESPKVSFTAKRKVSEHPEVFDASVNVSGDRWFAWEGSMLLYADNLARTGIYRRRVIFVKDSIPFVLDYNMFEEMVAQSGAHQVMHYYGNSTDFTEYASIRSWSRWNVSNSNAPNHSNASNLYLASTTSNTVSATPVSPLSNLTIPILEYENKQGTSVKNPYDVRRKVFRKTDSSKGFGLISILQVSNIQPTLPIEQIPIATDVHAGFHRKGNIYDVFILRRNPIGHLQFQFTDADGESSGILTLIGGKDYGFIRLRKENGSMLPVEGYTLNIWKKEYRYLVNTTITSPNFPIGASIVLGNNVTLTVAGSVNLFDGTSVTLGTGAAIVVSGSGRITANGTTFTSVDPDDPSKAYGMIQLLTSGNSFTDCVFQGGGNLGNLLVQGSGTQILGGELRKGGRGMVAASGDVQVRGTSISANHGSGIYVTSGSVRLGSSWTYMIGTGPTTYRQYEPVTVTSNGGPGIEVVGVGQVVLDSARVSGNTSREIHLGTGGRVYAGHGSSGGGGGLEIVYADMGWNHIGGSGYYIYNTALSFDGETYLSWTVPARYNFWGGPTAPPAGKFWGPVNRSDHLGTDPTQNHYQVCIAGCQYKALPGAAVTSAAMASAIASRADTPREGLDLVRARERILALRTQVDARPDHPSVIRLLMEWDDLVSFLGADKLREEDRSLGAWLTPRAAALSPATSTSVSGSRLVREASRVLEMRRQFRAGDMAALAEASADAVTRMGNPDNKLAVLLYRLEAMMALGRYEDAFRTLIRIESVRPEAGLAGLDHIPTDYSTYGHLLAEESGIRDWRTRFGGFVDEAQDPGAKTGLMPAWPNPFNPTTTIPFELAAEGRAYIAVYDLLGRQVAVLVDGVRASGAHQANLDARHLASGTYIVRAVLDGQVHTRKITLVK